VVDACTNIPNLVQPLAHGLFGVAANLNLVQPLAHGLFGLAANLIANSYG